MMTINCHCERSSAAYDVIFSGDVVYATVTHDPAAVSQWIYDVSSLYGHGLIVGLDIEWRPNYRRDHQNPAATLQLCVGRCCLIYQLIHSPYFPVQLIQFLSYSDHNFVGIEVKSDLKKLQRDHRIGYNARTVDLRRLAAKVYETKELKNAGLKTMARIVLGKEMEKPKWVTRSRWDNRRLTADQVEYACIDAFMNMSNRSLRFLMETNKLIGSNFLDWLQTLRVVLRMEDIEYVLDKEICIVPDKTSSDYSSFDMDGHIKHIEDAFSAQHVMLSSMTTELQMHHKHMFPYEMLRRLESLYASQSKNMDYEILRDLFECKLQEGGNVSNHVLKMMGLFKRLATTGTKLSENISVNLILDSLPGSFKKFIVWFNHTEVSVPELHNMLMTYETLASNDKVPMVSSSTKHANSKGNNKQKRKNKAFDVAALEPRGGTHKKSKLTKDECLFCREKGHWKRDCAKFKAQVVAD